MATLTIGDPLLGGSALPTSEAPARTEGTESGIAVQTYDVLVVEDNELTAMYIASLLDHAGYRAHLAGNGQEVSELSNRFVPQVILLDLGLPDIDGISLGQDLRQDPRYYGVPMIAVTADTEVDTLEKVFDSGLNGCIYKKDLNYETLIWEIHRQVTLSKQTKEVRHGHRFT